MVEIRRRFPSKPNREVQLKMEDISMSQYHQNINIYLASETGQNRTLLEAEPNECTLKIKQMEGYLDLFKDLTFELADGLKILKGHFQDAPEDSTATPSEKGGAS